MNTIVIDVREPHEYASGHYPGAINLSPARLMSKAIPELDGVPAATRVIVYCRTGSRSNVAMHLLSERGFTNVSNGINKDHVARMLDV